ncbi:MAG TPA: ABC transporter permease [Clostridiaceae bacterium]|jgi:peptide/nickel transport system permease protein|nr:ABC transporter permease [Clostridiaceae bacterium]
MARYILQKAGQMLITLLLIVFIVFIMFELIPGNPARIMLGMNASQEQITALELELGINEPLPLKIKNYFAGLIQGDLGRSIRFDKPVGELIGAAAPTTFSLAIYAFILIIVLSVPLALLAARKQGSFFDNSIRFVTETTLAIPPFFMAIILMLIFRTTQLGLSSGQGNLASPGFLRQFLMPALAIALSRVAMAMEFLRDAIIEQKRMFYTRAAVGKGATKSRILFFHIFRNSLVPFVTVLGLILAEVFGGSIIIEQVFLLPGLGRLLVTAVEARDFPLTQGIIILIAIVVIVVNFLVDLINQFIDPRIRLSDVKSEKSNLWTQLSYKLKFRKDIKR